MSHLTRVIGAKGGEQLEMLPLLLLTHIPATPVNGNNVTFTGGVVCLDLTTCVVEQCQVYAGGNRLRSVSSNGHKPSF